MTTRKSNLHIHFSIYSHTQRSFVITKHSLLVHKTRELNNLCHICDICHKFHEELLQTKQDPSYDSFRTLFIQSVIYTSKRRGVAPGTILLDPKGWTQILVCMHCT